MRRSAITNWAQRLSIQVVQQFAGHSNITTKRQYYLSVRPENMASASEVMNKMLQKAQSGLTQK
jgi:integrase